MTKRKAPAKPARKARKPLPADARLRDRPSLPVPSRRSRVYNRNVVAVSPFFSPTQGAIPGSGFAFTAAQSRRSMAENLQRHTVATEHRVTAIETHLSGRDGFVPQNHFGMRG